MSRRDRDSRRLIDLVSVGPKIEAVFHRLGIYEVTDLANQDAVRLFDRLAALDGRRGDPCLLDTFCAAIAQAKDPNLPAEKRRWWYWSKLRVEP